MKDLTFLTEHHSIPAQRLHEPAPDDRQLADILQCAMSAPDHGHLQPFRFLVIRGKARNRLAQIFEQAARRRTPEDETGIRKQREKPLRSPLIVTVIARIIDSPKIPHVEQLLCAGCAAQHIQLACRALGYGSIWLTGGNAYDPSVQEALGLDIDERIVGFLYIGTPEPGAGGTQRRSALELTSHWEQPARREFAL
jgi:nitroreductase